MRKNIVYLESFGISVLRYNHVKDVENVMHGRWLRITPKVIPLPLIMSLNSRLTFARTDPKLVHIACQIWDEFVALYTTSDALLTISIPIEKKLITHTPSWKISFMFPHAGHYIVKLLIDGVQRDKAELVIEEI